MRYAPVVRFYGVLRKSNADVFADKTDVLTLFCRFRVHKQPLVAGEKHFVFLGLRRALFDVGVRTLRQRNDALEAAVVCIARRIVQRGGVNLDNGAGGHEERFDLRRIVLAVFDVLLGADEQNEVGNGDVYFTIAVIFETV